MGPPQPVGIKEEAAPWRAPTAQSQAERRQLTVMFVDLVGSTALSTRLDPEEMREVIQAYQTPWPPRSPGLTGTSPSSWATACWPTSAGPRRTRTRPSGPSGPALALDGGGGAADAPGGEPLAARVGIATGLVVVGDLIGEGAAQEEAVVGETPNLAARLQAWPSRATVVVAEATRRLSAICSS